jgi:hypothetical protein
MRLLLPMLMLVASPAAISQNPPNEAPDAYITIGTPDGLLRMPVEEGLDESGQIERKVIVPPQVLQNETLIDSLRKQGLTPTLGQNPRPICNVDYSDIDAERKASETRLRVIKDKVIPLQHQYEQELYYWDRREKRFEEKCGVRKPSEWDQRRIDMTKKACKAIEVECKPVKHW